MGGHRRFGLVVAVVALSAALAGCGSSGGSIDSDQSAIEALLVRHYKMPSCDDLTSSGRTAFGHPVEDAACSADIRSQAPKDVSVSKVKIHGGTATAVAGRYTFTLRRVKGVWLIAG